jgi:NucS shadow ORF
MSLNVPAALLERAEQDDVTDADLVTCIKTSLPYAWSVVSELVDRTAQPGVSFADNQTPPPDELARGQLLRMMASDAMRRAVERHFDVRIAFQNCHRVAVFTTQADTSLHESFVSARAQLMNQSPELRNC